MSRKWGKGEVPPRGYMWFYGSTNGVPEDCFSNFYSAPVTIDGVVWPTTEHYFQAMKFSPDSAAMELVRAAERPADALSLGKSRDLPFRADWDTVKVGVMRKALAAKFTQHEACKAVLLATGDVHIVEHTRGDSVWADAGKPWNRYKPDENAGTNFLGVLLTELRDRLRAEGEEVPS